LKWKGPVFEVSALNRSGCDVLVRAVYEHVSKLKQVIPDDPDPRCSAAGEGEQSS
jgi:GTP-binding protein